MTVRCVTAMIVVLLVGGGCGTYWRADPAGANAAPSTWTTTIAPPAAGSSDGTVKTPRSSASIEERLRELQSLYEKGLISKDDLKQRRAQILQEL